METLKKSFILLEKVKMKKYLIFLFFMMLIASILETLSIGAILPMMQFIFNSDEVFFLNSENFKFLKNSNDNETLIFMILVVVIIFLIDNNIKPLPYSSRGMYNRNLPIIIL